MAKNIQTMSDHWLKLFICLVFSMSTYVSADCNNASITILESAVAEGAVCLDGSPPAYYYAKGFGDGANNWVLHMEGGGWCSSEEGCAARLKDPLGSSKYKDRTQFFGQIKSRNQTENPDFYNWNRVYVAYCDSSSYMGDVESETNISRRGAKIFNAIVEDLLAKGMANAENAILSGGSAGALGAILHCDGFSELLPNAKRVKCVSDSGVFVHARHLPGADKRADMFARIAAYHGIPVDSLPSSCTSRMNASLCLFPENIIGGMKTPLFLVESSFDQYQLWAHYFSNETTAWKNCTDTLELCTPSQLQIMKEYGIAVRQTLQEISDTTSVAMFVHSCFRHGHFYEKSGWDASYILGGKTIAQAIGDWFYDRSFFQEIDYNNELPLFRNCTKLTASIDDPGYYV